MEQGNSLEVWEIGILEVEVQHRQAQNIGESALEKEKMY